MPNRFWWRHGDRLAFRCLGCEQVHEVVVGGPHAWGFNGSDDTLTLTPSVLVRWGDGRVCHSFVKDGRIQFLADCTHKLAGQTVPLPAFGDPYARAGLATTEAL